MNLPFACAILSFICQLLFVRADTDNRALTSIQHLASTQHHTSIQNASIEIGTLPQGVTPNVKRANGLTWNDAVCYGEQVLDGIESQRGHSIPTPFDNYNQIQQAGWRIKYDLNAKVPPPASIEPVLGNDLKGPKWASWSAELDAGGQTYKLAWLIIPGSAVILTSVFGPKPGVLDPSRIQRPSDLLWLSWEKACKDAGKDSGRLRHVYSDFIAREETVGILHRACDDMIKGSKDGRCHFRAASEQGKAVVGTPAGLALGMMMLHRFKEMPKRTLSGIGVWNCPDDKFCLGVTIEEFDPAAKVPPAFEAAKAQIPDSLVTMRQTRFRSFTGKGPLYMYSKGFGSCAGVVICSKKGCLLGHYNPQVDTEKFLAEGLADTIDKNKAALQGAKVFLFVPYWEDPNEISYQWQADQLSKLIKDKLGLTAELAKYSSTDGMGVDDWMDYMDRREEAEVRGEPTPPQEITRASIVVQGGDSAEPHIQFEGKNLVGGEQKRSARLRIGSKSG